MKKGHSSIIAQFHANQVVEDPTLDIHSYMQVILEKHQQVFGTPKGLPPSIGEHYHIISLIPRSQPSNIRPYRYPFAQNNEIEKII